MAHYDDAPVLLGKQLEELQLWAFVNGLKQHLSTSGYLAHPDSTIQPPIADQIFHSNNELWEAFLRTKQLRIGHRVTLQSFFIFEWFPRSPGLYFTERGRDARREAQNRIRTIDNGVIVFDPYGKMSMLDGGIGNVRLRPIVVGGRDLVLMSGSSDGECHAGFPLAVPLELYESIIDEIRARGAVVRTVSGILKAIPKDLDFLYERYRDVPKLYLLVDEGKVPAVRKSRSMGDLNVSVASSFLSEYEGSPKVYACYVNTDPGDPNSLQDRVRWMEQTYVAKGYGGKIVTDFDELENHFDSAIFGLSKIMTLGLTSTDFNAIGSFSGSLNVGQIIVQQTVIKEQRMSQYNVFGSAGAVGDNARAENFIQSAASDLSGLAQELSLLKQTANERAQSNEQREAVQAISEAEEAAKAGNSTSMLKKLKAAGTWAAEIATSIGKDVLAKIIESQLGMS